MRWLGLLIAARQLLAFDAGKERCHEQLQSAHRNRLGRDLGHDFRQYFLIEAWSPELALEALQHDLDVGTILPATFAMYELADGQTAVVAREPFSTLIADPERRQAAPALATIADREIERVARVLARLEHTASHHASELPAA
jgi:uncharacterized protein (DUF302 family)